MRQRHLHIIKHTICAVAILGIMYVCCLHPERMGGELTQRRALLMASKPEWVLVGNSILRSCIDEKRLNDITGTNALKVTSNGSASAWWYLYVHNVIGASEHRPKGVFIFFRDRDLTNPRFRTQGMYRKPLRLLSKAQEPLLSRLVDDCWGNERMIDLAVAGAKEWMERMAFQAAGKCSGVRRQMVNDAVAHVFADDNMDSERMTQLQLNVETLEADADCDFDQEVEDSFLPHLIATAQEKEIPLIFVRTKRRRDVDGSEPQSQKRYMEGLKKYLVKHNVDLIDFTDEVGLNLSHFGAGDHFNKEGNEIMTVLLADAMKPIIEKTRGVHECR